MLEVSFLATFLGGVLALFSPCSALLLPIFFATAFAGRAGLLRHTVVFYLGLCTVLVPLGTGMSLVGAAALDHRDTTILVAGLALVGFGLLELSGRGLRVAPAALTGRVRLGRGVLAVYTTGLVYGIAGFCAGPLLGAVLAIAATTAVPLLGAVLLAVYCLGIAAPLFVLAWAWDRWSLSQARWLRGRVVRLGPWQVHSSNLIAGLLFIGLGGSFIAFQGGGALSGLYAAAGLDDAAYVLQDWIGSHVGGGWDLAAGLLLGVLAVVARRRYTTHH